VQPETGWILHEPVPSLGDNITREIAPGIHLSSAPEALRVLAKSPPKRIRFVLGYAGWAPGQLEAEIARGDWSLAPATPDAIFGAKSEHPWPEPQTPGAARRT